MRQIDKNSKIPRYYQIQKEIESRLLKQWEVDEKIPSEAQLMEEFDVSRNTVKKAIEELVNIGMLYRIQGKGTFVRKKQITQSLDQLYSFSQAFQAQGFELKNELISVDLIPAPARVSEALQLAPNDLVIKLVRLRNTYDKPIILETSYFNARYVRAIEPFYTINERSLYEILATDFHITITHAEESFEAVNLTEAEAVLLQVDEGQAAMHLERTAYDSNQRIIEYCESKVKKGSFKFSIKLM